MMIFIGVEAAGWSILTLEEHVAMSSIKQRRLTIWAWRAAKIDADAEARERFDLAIAFLRRTGPYGIAPRPDLILLDWNLPRKNGQEVLAEVKADADLKAIPIVILTTSQAERDILTAYGLHANRYITKPVNFKNSTQVIREIGNFWLTVVTLPPR
jgi:two-component system response regulator